MVLVDIPVGKPVSGSVDHYSALRTFKRSSIASRLVHVSGYSAVGGRGGGWFEHRGNGFSASDDDDCTFIVNDSTGDGYARLDFHRGLDIDVTWGGAFPVDSWTHDVKPEVLNIANWHPESALIYPKGSRAERYGFSGFDIHNDVDRAFQESRLGSNVNATLWEYEPHWRGSHKSMGEPQGSGSILSLVDAATNDYAIKTARRPGALDQNFTNGSFSDLEFWGDTNNKDKVALLMDNSGSWTRFYRCKWRFADAGLKQLGIFKCYFEDCTWGDRGTRGVNVGFWGVTGQPDPIGNPTKFVYTGNHLFVNCNMHTELCGFLLDNRDNNNPASGNRFVDTDMENSNGLTLLAFHEGYGSPPTVWEQNYMEMQNVGGNPALDLTKYNAGIHNAPDGYAYKIVGRGQVEFYNTGQGIIAEQDPDKAALPSPDTDPNGPIVNVKWDRWRGDHMFDDNSVLNIENRIPTEGAHGALGNNPAKRHYTFKENVDVGSASRMTQHFIHASSGGLLNNYTEPTTSDKLVVADGTTLLDSTGAPMNGYATEVTMPSGGSLQIRGNQIAGGGPGGTGFQSTADSQIHWSAFTFWLQAVAGGVFPMEIHLRNSRRSVPGYFEPAILLEDTEAVSYSVKFDNNMGGAWTMYLHNTSANEVKFLLGDIQHIASTRRQDVENFLNGCNYAVVASS